MVKEVISHLIPVSPTSTSTDKQPMYIDATVGGGGHAQAILEKISKGIVIGLDWDNDAIKHTKLRLQNYPNLYLVHTSYANLDQIVQEFPEYYVQGILFDLGVSYYQITTPERGFSYNSDGPLDMRFDQSVFTTTAQQIIQRTPILKLIKIFSDFGEERKAHKIAVHVLAHRNLISNTQTLANIIKEIIPARFQNKTLSRIFQSLRIVVNSELENVKIGLEKAIELLSSGARMVVISYHSLEDRIVKQTFRHNSEQGILKILTKKPLRPEPVEISQNPSARSARLRAVEKI
jgi:16S rRNA (cytosine1402-N4)-methyltransferase